jgi:thiol-disulfide isomerase/thioredoxin
MKRISICCAFLLIFFFSSAQNEDSTWFANYLDQFKLDTGTFLPTTPLRKSNGESFDLASLKGKVVYVDVWATWCGPCIANFPYSTQRQERLDKLKYGMQVVLLNVCTNSSFENWKKTMSKHNPSGINVFANDSSIVSLWGINSWPTYILLDQNGKVVGKNISSPSEVPMIDYLIHLTVIKKDILNGAWDYFRSKQIIRSQKAIDGATTNPFTTWFYEESFYKSYILFSKWDYAYRKSKGEHIPKSY